MIAGLLAEWRELPSTKRRLLAACGAGAGISAVYNVPFGGALFALEVLLGTLSLPLVAPAFLATLTGTATAWLLLPNEPTYHVPAMPLTPGLIAWALFFAPVAGVASAAFVKLIGFAAELKPTGWLIPVSALVVFPVLGLLATVYPQLLGNGKDVVELAAVDRIAPPTLAALLLLKPLATAACLGTGAPGGLFTPTMTFGALLGGVLGHLWLHIWPDAPAGAFALVGAGVVLAATTKGPISALVLTLELTHHLDGLLVPLLLATAGAVSIAYRLDPQSTYTSRLRQKSIVGEHEVLTATRFADLVETSLRSGCDLAVVDEAGEAVGTLSSGDLTAAYRVLEPLAIATALDVLEAKNSRTSRAVPTGTASAAPRRRLQGEFIP